MSRPRFQADADFNQKIIAGLRRREPAIDFRTAPAAAILGLPDIEVIARAAAEGRILVSHDRRTMPAHFANFIAGQQSPGLIIISQSCEIGAAIEDLHLVWSLTEPGDWIDQIGYLPL